MQMLLRSQMRSSVVWIAIVFTIMIGLALFLFAVHRLTNANILWMVNDAVDVGNLPKYSGMYTYLGGVVLAVAGAIAWFTAFVLRSVSALDGRGSFLLLLGAAIGWLGIDDILLFHEWFGFRVARALGSAQPEVDGQLHEAWVFGGYAVVWISLIVLHWRRIVSTAWLLLGLALASFALSVGLDLVHSLVPEMWEGRPTLDLVFSVAEDLTKIMGYFFLLAYVVQTCAGMLRDALTPGSVGRSRRAPGSVVRSGA